ncbi:MAG: hypothetical protein ABR589_04025 [Chthoniobacterales bacterium]
MTAAEIYESVTNGGTSTFAEAAAIFDRHGPWCLIGGLALNHYVNPVYSTDADVVLAFENFLAVDRELMKAGYTVASCTAFLTAGKPDGRLWFDFHTAPRYQAFIGRAERAEVLGSRVPIASLSDLLQGKVWAWNHPGRLLSQRKKDELDLIRIGETYPELRDLMPPEITHQFRDL